MDLFVAKNYLPGENDVYVSPSQIRRFNLKTGDILVGNIRIKTQNEKYSALLYVQSVNGYKPFDAAKRKNFEDLTPIFPNERINLETENAPLSMRMVDLLSPDWKGTAWNDRFSAKDRKDHIIKTDCKKYYGNKTQYEGYRSSN